MNSDKLLRVLTHALRSDMTDEDVAEIEGDVLERKRRMTQQAELLASQITMLESQLAAFELQCRDHWIRIHELKRKRRTIEAVNTLTVENEGDAEIHDATVAKPEFVAELKDPELTHP